MDAVGTFWKGFAFMALGIFISWGYLTQSDDPPAASIPDPMATLRPNPLPSSL